MRMRDPLDVQRTGLTEALERRLASDPETAGLQSPAGLSIEVAHDGSVTARMGKGFWTTRHPPMLIEPRPQEDAGIGRNDMADRLVAYARRAIRLRAQDFAPADAPSWAVLAHPLALAVIFSHLPDRRRLPIGFQPGCGFPSERWDVDDDGNPAQAGRCGVAVAQGWVGYGVLHLSHLGVLMPISGRDGIAAVTVASGPERTTITVPCSLPNTAIAQLDGQRLGRVLELPTSGDAELDALAADCIIAGHRELPGGIELTLARTRCVPAASAPTESLARALALAPEMR